MDRVRLSVRARLTAWYGGSFPVADVVPVTLHEITATAHRLKAEDLDRRINHDGPDDELKDLAHVRLTRGDRGPDRRDPVRFDLPVDQVLREAALGEGPYSGGDLEPLEVPGDHVPPTRPVVDLVRNVRSITHAHQGSVTAKAIPDGGPVVEVNLPITGVRTPPTCGKIT